MAQSICPTCGGSKDRRAVECRSCGMARKARTQWSNPQTRARMERSIRAVSRGQRRTFADISETTNWQYKTDGRAYTYYWEDDSKKYIYRYQWRWRCSIGPIPAGHVIHHKNHDQTDDRLENLECILPSQHNHIHLPETLPAMFKGRGIDQITDGQRACQQCGAVFDIRTRVKSNRFCSLECYHASMRHHPTWTCRQCGKAFQAPTEHGRDRKYCSRECWTMARRSMI